ncbi:hypothetical protein [Nocardia mexicana]|uniref:Uncharacterized protein n=1 Tax=Nocardia mexicana TaxID=279262 RepID=A0A370H9G6_9NOCA|nr:hypothetical protein [Nocardia mexicana]RDI53056.1 hypothetical protein DFR68_103444 [Nocardia mexicana]
MGFRRILEKLLRRDRSEQWQAPVRASGRAGGVVRDLDKLRRINKRNRPRRPGQPAPGWGDGGCTGGGGGGE